MERLSSGMSAGMPSDLFVNEDNFNSSILFLFQRILIRVLNLIRVYFSEFPSRTTHVQDEEIQNQI